MTCAGQSDARKRTGQNSAVATWPEVLLRVCPTQGHGSLPTSQLPRLPMTNLALRLRPGLQAIAGTSGPSHFCQSEHPTWHRGVTLFVAHRDGQLWSGSVTCFVPGALRLLQTWLAQCRSTRWFPPPASGGKGGGRLAQGCQGSTGPDPRALHLLRSGRFWGVVSIKGNAGEKGLGNQARYIRTFYKRMWAATSEPPAPPPP